MVSMENLSLWVEYFALGFRSQRGQTDGEFVEVSTVEIGLARLQRS
jgi:hypothetical protein